MHTDPDEEYVAVDVQLPSRLVSDIDAFAVTHGYTSPDAVVAEALDRM